ncbi:MAG TPA: hypothetical protein VEB00_16955 [Clostridia bacterium]|nr:hypothetical protein [Clostridia bacterium]
MQQNNAKQGIQDVYDRLVTCMDTLNQSLSSAEKEENKQRIKNTLGAIDNAIEITNNALANYRD